MAFNFPATPTLGDEYASGGITFVWNGYGWNVKASDAPIDDKLYGRKNATWAEIVSDVTKSYVDTELAKRVAKTGDAMSGDLSIVKVDPSLVLNKSAALETNAVYGRLNGAHRWLIAAGNAVAETGGNVGSDFGIYRYADNGGYLASALYINRSSGNVTIGSELAVSGGATVTGAIITSSELKLKQGAVGTIRFGPDDGPYLHFNGTKLSVSRRLGVPAPTEADDATNYNHVEDRANAWGSYHAGSRMAIAGGTFTGKVAMNASPYHIAWASGDAGLQVYGNSGYNHAYMEFHRPGFATNFGMDENGNFRMGGWSHGGGNWYQFWTTRDFTALPSVTPYYHAAQWAYIADTYHPSSEGIKEPHAGGVVTGATGIDGGVGYYNRYRVLQVLNYQWWNVGYT